MSTYDSFISVIQYLYITFQKRYSLRCAHAPPPPPPPPHTHTHTHVLSLSLSLSLSLWVSKHVGHTCRGHLEQNILCATCADS